MYYNVYIGIWGPWLEVHLFAEIAAHSNKINHSGLFIDKKNKYDDLFVKVKKKCYLCV